MEEQQDKKAGAYSLGMKQRLGLANALIKKPKLLILDEPTNGLDPHGIKNLREILKQISNERHMSILISSHILAEVENICDRIVIIDKGKIIEDGSFEKLMENKRDFFEFYKMQSKWYH